MSNMDLWRSVCVTDPKAVKAITGKPYAGNSPKPYWIVEQLTARFGPCGIGWGFHIISERIERFSDTDTLHIAAVRFWYELDGKRGELEQIGQTKASYMTAGGKFMLDEDAPKKSVTDAIVKCASYIGFAGDIFAGRWDDSKYVAEANQEWRRRESSDSGADPERALWLAGWLEAITLASTVGECKKLTQEAIQEAKSEQDGDAEGQFMAAQATKMAKARVAA